MGKVKKRIWKLFKKIYFCLKNLAEWAITWPFLEPRIGAILLATIAGIILSLGVELLVRFFDNNGLRSWGLIQSAGVLFIIASSIVSGVAWFLQSFYDHLRNIDKDKTSLNEKKLQFLSWNDRWRVWILALLAIAMLIFAFVILISASAAKTTSLK
jgi:preprotein translocase subunit SecY